MKDIIITPFSSKKLLDLSEIWRYRELLYIFTWRDIKVRYKQTILGILWVIFQPIVTMAIFTFFFGNLAKISSGGLPYALFSLCGLVYWNFFSGALSHASDSMLTNESIIKKVYIPKIIIPLSSVITGFIDYLINFFLLIFFALSLGYIPQVSGLIIFPLGIILTMISAFGLGLFLSSFNVKYRDVRYILPFFIQILLFITPVIYPLSIVSERNRLIMALNPMTTVVELTRFVFSVNYKIYPHLIIISLLSSLVILMFGLWYFRKTEQFFADVV
ncbi:phosphate ABC transporter permease [Candidatus Gottesmanbacteria bacterium RIFCSPHIGHO2_02_FULL_39_14]|uniref:Transport permease protein n=1 Tax=Candidatus Gottesmanbacteria bacterium RIFCSPHIGHO2_02_FULL_39_14 TaxID=1798383 RepID=A0A1F5ZU83_9BACT|nr:MAG: phosphate ABC transporter permease [Candidatus Gottesmanbacteria bacterium RIFCSPHIGHO2_02_FULL_39_14]